MQNNRIRRLFNMVLKLKFPATTKTDVLAAGKAQKYKERKEETSYRLKKNIFPLDSCVKKLTVHKTPKTHIFNAISVIFDKHSGQCKILNKLVVNDKQNDCPNYSH